MLATLVIALLSSPQDLAFMAGAWEGGDGVVRFEERWTEEAGGLMLGVSRTLKEGRAIGFEFLRIEFRSDGIFYVAQPGGKAKTEFKLTSADGRSATFENPGHDHPKRIRYSLDAEGALRAELEGDEGRQQFLFRRVRRP